jgi:hypothetical protein
MAGWFLDIRDERGTTVSSLKDVSFADVKVRIIDAKKLGEIVTFTPPLNVPRIEIDELVRMGARKSLP